MENGDQLGLGSLYTAFSFVRAIFIILDTLMIYGFFLALIKSWQYRPHVDESHAPSKPVLTLQGAIFKERWESIMSKFKSGSPEAMRIVIIEADALVDEALKQLGILGEHMADRLSKLNPSEVKSLNKLWQAHRFRNDIVHTPGFSIAPSDTELALKDYEAFLKEIGAL